MNFTLSRQSPGHPSAADLPCTGVYRRKANVPQHQRGIQSSGGPDGKPAKRPATSVGKKRISYRLVPLPTAIGQRLCIVGTGDDESRTPAQNYRKALICCGKRSQKTAIQTCHCGPGYTQLTATAQRQSEKRSA